MVLEASQFCELSSGRGGAKSSENGRHEKVDAIRNFSSMTPLSVDIFKSFDPCLRSLAITLALVRSLFGKVQTCVTHYRSIFDNLHFIEYFIVKIGNKPYFGQALIDLNQSKAFDTTDRLYLAA